MSLVGSRHTHPCVPGKLPDTVGGHRHRLHSSRVEGPEEGRGSDRKSGGRTERSSVGWVVGRTGSLVSVSSGFCVGGPESPGGGPASTGESAHSEGRWTKAGGGSEGPPATSTDGPSRSRWVVSGEMRRDGVKEGTLRLPGGRRTFRPTHPRPRHHTHVGHWGPSRLQ